MSSTGIAIALGLAAMWGLIEVVNWMFDNTYEPAVLFRARVGALAFVVCIVSLVVLGLRHVG